MVKKNIGILRKEYQEKYDLSQKLLEAARGDIVEILRHNNIVMNAVIGRVKTFESFRLKAIDGISKGLFTDPINEMQDLIGIRSILVFVEDLKKIPKVLSPTFKILKTERKGSQNADDTFGYESDHYILQYDEVKGPRYKDIHNMKFELQVRTILMDGWASLSHEIDYKTNSAIPSELRKIFFGLSGMFVVADKTFQDLRNASKANQERLLKENTLNSVLSQEINLDTLKTYLSIKFKTKWIEQEKLPDNDKNYSEFIEEIRGYGGYKIIKDIDEAIEASLPAEKIIEPALSANNSGQPLHLVGTLRAILDIYDDTYFNRHKAWGELITQSVWVNKIKEARDISNKRKYR